MEPRIDFLQYLESDMSLDILMCLDDLSDLIRASSVSRFWRHFVIANGLCKQLCVRMFPQLASIARVIELDYRMKKSADVGFTRSVECETLERDHKVYASLFRALTTFQIGDCIALAISASSTDNYPRESIINTLDPRDIIIRRGRRTLYWSSKGHSDPGVPETLVYKLRADFCAINEINIRPFQAYFQAGLPIYSAKSVRFRIGHPKYLNDIEKALAKLPLEQCADDKFIWTYTSQEFPMTQENQLQKFKLPEPVLCIGGFLQIELLGRVQKQEMDGLFYICVSHVQAVGRSLSPAFGVEVLEPSGKFLLKYNAENFHCTLQSLSSGSPSAASGVPLLPQPEVLMWPQQWEGLVEFLMHGNEPGVELDDEWDDEDDEEEQ